MKRVTLGQLTVMFVMLAGAARADDGCRIVEFVDHYEVECVGNGAPVSPQAEIQENYRQAQSAYQPPQPSENQDGRQEVKVVNTSRSFGAYKPRTSPR